MTFRWLVILVIYTLLIGPMMDMPNSGARAKNRSQASRVEK
jgi:hypothetical protein